MENLFGHMTLLEKRVADVEREVRKAIELLQSDHRAHADIERALRLIIALEHKIIAMISPPKATQVVITLGTPVSQ